MSKFLSLTTLLLTLSWTAMAQTADGPYPVAADAGRIEQLDLGASTLVVGGIRFGLAVDVVVEIDGTHGAFTLLEPGMRIYYEYLVVSPERRLMVLIRELPDNVELQET